MNNVSPEFLRDISSDKTYLTRYAEEKGMSLTALEKLKIYKNFPFVAPRLMISRFVNGPIEDRNIEMAAVLKLYSTARPFNIDDAIMEEMSDRFNKENLTAPINFELVEEYAVDPLAIPFLVCWFEAGDCFLSRGYSSEDGSGKDATELSVGAVLALNGPTAVHLLSSIMMAKSDGSKPKMAIFSSILPYDSSNPTLNKLKEHDLVGRLSYDFLRRFLRFQKEKCAWTESKINHQFRVGSGKDRRLCKIKDSVNVILKKNKKKYEESIGKEVDWSHRWEVMGHWRAHDGTGKDQFGKYCIQGFTWVVPHEKGPQEKPLVIKSRDIHLE